MKTIQAILLAFLCGTSFLYAQEAKEAWELSSAESGNKEYVARDYISLKPGFSYQATSGNTFNAKIDERLLFPPTENTYANPDGTITGDPTQGAVVGGIPGQFDVSSTGAATYTIPIECPSGINGMQPNISLVYNSQSGNGVAGWRWSLSGTSAITKGTKTIFSDSAAGGIDLSIKSDYYLDGNKLFVKSGFTYGATGAEYETEIRTYVQIKQTASAANGHPSKFTVTDKNGTVMEYGQVAKPKNASYPFQWLVSKITDANGNFVKYTYKTNANATQTVLDYIEYGSNGTTAAPLKIVFTYGSKSYVQKQWISGYYFEDYYLLQSIAVKSNQTQLRNYQLTYDYRDEKHFPTTLKLSNENGESLPATIIEWGVENKTVEVKDQSSLRSITAGATGFLAYDMTGNGISDLIEMAASGNNTIVRVYEASGTGNCGFTQFGNGKSFPVSFDNKKIKQEADNFLIVRHYNKNWISLLVANSNNTFFRLYDVANDNDNMNTRDILVSNNKLSLLYTIADFNNDGNDEILYVDKKRSFSGKILYLKQNLPNVSSETVFSGSLSSTSDILQYIFSSDFNADGLIDVAVMSKNSIRMYKNNGGTMQSDTIVHTGFSFVNDIIFYMTDNQHAIKPGDFNGDGLMDFISYDGNENFKLLVSDGNFGFTTYSLSNITMIEDTGTDVNDKKDDFIVTDFNHDGKSDLIVIDVKYNSNDVYLGTGIKWFASNGTAFTQVKSNSFNDANYYYKGYATTGDFNGDGKEDVFSYNANLAGANINTNQKYKIHTTFNAANADTADFSGNLVKKITYGMKNHTIISYQPLSLHKTSESQSYFYEKEGGYYGSIFPASYIQMPLYCVRYLNEGDSDFFIDSECRYKYGRMHWQGKGFLGFETVIKKDLTRDRELRNFTTLDDSTYLPSTLTTEVAAAQRVERYFDIKKSGKVITSRPDLINEYDYLAGLSKTTKYLSYDNYGNLTKQKTTQGELVQTDTIAYIQRGAWCANKPGYMQTIASYQSLRDTIIKTFDYDNKGNLVQEVLHPNKPLFKVTTEYADFDAFGHPQTVSVKAKDKDGVEHTRTTSQNYTTSGRFSQSKTNLLGETTAYSWDETRGLLDYETDHWGKVTDYTYDSWGNLRETRYPDGARKTFVLQWAGNTGGKPSGAVYYSYTETSGESPLIVWYDALGREIRTEFYGLNNKKVWVDTEYNAKGQFYRVSEPYFTNETKTWAATHAYDSYGRVLYRQTPLGTDTTLYAERTTTVITPEGAQSTTANTSGFTESNTVNGKTVNYTYYPNGLVKTATPEGGQALAMEYDPHGNRTKLTDPDAGEIQTLYNGFGELVEEKQKIHNTSAWITTVSNYAFATGLLQSIVRNGETTTYAYDNNLGHPGRIQSVEIAGQHKQSFYYDNFSRLTNLKEEIDGRTYNCSTEYDVFGRVKKDIYPSGYYTVNHYDSNGLFYKITDRDGRSLWEAKEENARGQLTREKKGNKETTYTYCNTGHPEFVYASGIMDNWYQFDGRGNQIYRDECAFSPYPSENFQYDALNRLTNWTVNNNTANNIVYNSTTGNIQTKSNIGNYTMNYGVNGKPHALTSISGIPSNFPTSDLSVTYTDFKKIKTLTEGNKFYQVMYGVDEQRRKSVYKESSVAKETRYYLGNYEEKIDHSSDVTEKIHYLDGAVYIERSNGANNFYYTYTDNLGSLTALVNESGTVVERYAYDPWGKRRNPNNWVQDDTRTSWILNRGYTGHEHLDQFGIINMNGRVYDPLTAMFFSPDPYLQAPGNWLNYNRYTYCLNNPFLYTDPDGEWIHIVIGALVGGVINWAAHGAQFSWEGLAAFGIGVAGGAVTAATGGAALGTFGAAAGAGGFIGGAVAGGIAYTHGTVVTSIGNNVLFGDPMPTVEQLAVGSGVAMLTGGVSNGIFAASSGNNFWSGNSVAQGRGVFAFNNTPKPATVQSIPKIQGPAIPQPDLSKIADQLKTPLKDLPGSRVYTLDNSPRFVTIKDGIVMRVDPNFRDPSFRANLIKASGFDPGKVAQAHHIFPVEHGGKFVKAGIDINKYGAWWETGSHLQNAYQYNKAWDLFFIKNTNPTQYQIWQEAIRLKAIYGY